MLDSGEDGDWCATEKRWGFCNENCPRDSIGEYIDLPTNLDEEGKEITEDKEKHVTILRSKTKFNGEPNSLIGHSVYTAQCFIILHKNYLSQDSEKFVYM